MFRGEILDLKHQYKKAKFDNEKTAIIQKVLKSDSSRKFQALDEIAGGVERLTNSLFNLMLLVKNGHGAILVDKKIASAKSLLRRGILDVTYEFVEFEILGEKQTKRFKTYVLTDYGHYVLEVAMKKGHLLIDSYKKKFERLGF